MGEDVQSKESKNLCLDFCLKLEIKVSIIELFLLDIYSLANNKLQ